MNVSPALKQQFYDTVQPLSTQVRVLQFEIKKASYNLGEAFGWASVRVLSAEPVRKTFVKSGIRRADENLWQGL